MTLSPGETCPRTSGAVVAGNFASLAPSLLRTSRVIGSPTRNPAPTPAIARASSHLSFLSAFISPLPSTQPTGLRHRCRYSCPEYAFFAQLFVAHYEVLEHCGARLRHFTVENALHNCCLSQTNFSPLGPKSWRCRELIDRELRCCRDCRSLCCRVERRTFKDENFAFDRHGTLAARSSRTCIKYPRSLKVSAPKRSYRWRSRVLSSVGSLFQNAATSGVHQGYCSSRSRLLEL